MNVPTPRNAQEASLQIRVVERAAQIAVELIHGGEYYAYTNNGDSSCWTMGKRSGSTETDTTYLLDLFANTCSCPFFEKEKYCKHFLALKMNLDRIAEEEAQEAQCERAEHEMRDCELWETGCDPFAHI